MAAPSWDIFAGIDGTGDADDTVYARDFKDSCVNELARSWPRQAFAFYQRGPTASDLNLGDNTRQKAGFAYDFIYMASTSGKSLGKNSRVFLAGYSRGGAAVIDVCHRLHRVGIRVDCLFLYDAVDMSMLLANVDRIPPNVALCYHARRDPGTRSRPDWGNCVTYSTPTTRLPFPRAVFNCTHAGMGGVPWTREQKPTMAGDKIVEGYPVQGTKNAMRYVFGTIAPGPASGAVATTVTLLQDKSGSDYVRSWMRSRWNAALYGQQA